MNLNKNRQSPTELPRYFGNYLDESFYDWALGGPMKFPAINVKEHTAKYDLEIIIPGLKKELIKVQVDGDRLQVSYEDQETKRRPDEKYTKMEYALTRFIRWIEMPVNADKEGIAANYVDGVLRVSIPKLATESTSIRTINIQ